MARPPLSRRRLLGLDRSGPPPPETLRGAPLRPFTLPNAIGLIRLCLIPVFLVVALGSGDGRDPLAAVLFIAIAWGDQLDGITARLTGQYSRLGALIDPLTDRLLVISGVVVCWHFALLPRWALAVLAAREVAMLVLTQAALRTGLDVEINMIGRWAVWPVMAAIATALVVETAVAELLLYVGLAMTLAATALYLEDGYRQLKASSST